MRQRKWGISAISHEHCHIQCEGVREGGKMGSHPEIGQDGEC